jgi:hypothetical protein
MVQCVSENVLVTRLIRELHYHAHKSLPLDHLLNQLKPVHSLIHSFAKNNFNIIVQPTPSGLFPLKSPVKFYYAFLISDLLLRVDQLATKLTTR